MFNIISGRDIEHGEHNANICEITKAIVFSEYYTPSPRHYTSANLKYPPGQVATGYSVPQYFTDSDMGCHNHNGNALTIIIVARVHACLNTYTLDNHCCIF